MNNLNVGANCGPGDGYVSPGAPVNGVSEVVTLTGTATGGNFTLTVGAFTSAVLPYSASAAAIADALLALPCVTTDGSGNPNVACGGGALGAAAVTASFQNALAGYAMPAITVNAANLTGGTVTAVVTTAAVPGTFRGAPVGATLKDTVNGELYMQKGTPTLVVWTKIGP